ncbi:MAG: prolyl aminopeptidase [Porticoccaceae bacterium]
MRTLYPQIRPNTSTMLPVGDGHRLYVEECGKPDGLPVLFVHGGPGGGCRETDRCFFDPEKYRIILFDQRGCGRSSPHSSLEANATEYLIADIELLRTHLGIDKWAVFGGSWGSTLALLYAQSHPERILGLILRGIFLCRPRDIGWFYQSGANYIFPDYWKDFVSQVAPKDRDDIVAAYYRQLTSDNELERMGAAKAWSLWEGRCATLNPNAATVNHFASPRFALALARIEAHYFINQCFLQPNQILENAPRLADIPGVIVHGRYDIVCPVEQAVVLAEAWPKAQLEIIRDAGHASSEPGITDALIKATDAMAMTLGAVS